MKTCPHCAEEIQDAAVKCKHCGERLDTARYGAELADRPTERGLAAGAELGGRYRILAVAGRGGMGVVYRAEDQTLGIEVAVKVLPPEVSGDSRAVAALKAEAKLCLGLTHPNIVRLFDFREMEGLSCLIMEYVGGGSLLQRLSQHPGGLPEAEAVRCALQAAAGLGHAHARGVLHRDVKPANLLVGDDGAVKVADFGIARIAQDSLTRVTGHVTSGTFVYMSPEQLDGESCDARSDIYSLGITLYELLSGNVPFHTGDIYRQQKEKAPSQLAGVSEWLWNVLERMLAKSPTARYQTMGEVAAALEDGGRGAESERRQGEEKVRREAEEHRKVAEKAETDRKAHEDAQRREQVQRAAAEKIERDRLQKERTEAERLAKDRKAPEADLCRAEDQKSREAARLRGVEEARLKREQVEREEKARREREQREQAKARRTKSIVAVALCIIVVLGLAFVNRWQSGKMAEEAVRQAQLQSQAQDAEQQRQAEEAKALQAKVLSEIRDVLAKYLDAHARLDTDSVTAWYGNQIDYYSAGNVLRAFVRKDKDNLFRSWSSAAYNLTGEPQIWQEGSLICVKFVYDFHVVKRDGRQVSGQAENTWKMTHAEDGMKIVYEKQKVSRRTGGAP